ncbi:MAG TPA: hypothetical protein PKM72_02325 [Nitrospirales bacterium]|nr:hypothetical protein [Nitrospirales bacterium]
MSTYIRLRMSHDGNHLVVLNFSGEPQTLERDHSFQARVCLSTFLDKEGEEIHGRLDLRGHEGLILSCD